MGRNALPKSQCIHAIVPVTPRVKGHAVTGHPSTVHGQPRNAIACRLALLIGLFMPFCGVAADAALAADCADVELVLAIDGSGSIDADEFALQRLGYSSAFRRRDVQNALKAAGTVDVAVVLWGDTEMEAQVLSWVRLTDGQSTEVLAARLDGLVRKVHGDTGLGRGLSLALDLLGMPGRCGLRKIVNVSGDGYETISPRARHHIPLAHSRKRAADMGVVVNALAVENEVPDLAEWYSKRVTVGPGAFVMRVEGFETFADAIAMKLIREIEPSSVALDQKGMNFLPTGAKVPGPLVERNG